MASRAKQAPENVPGSFYVVTSCVDCAVCLDLAPEVFKRLGRKRSVYVANQPSTDDQLARSAEALVACPVGAIGRDGA
jgi:ferredoxin